MKIGFLIIDMQAIFLQDTLEKKIVDRACEYINYVSDIVRSRDHLVIHIQDVEGMEEANKELYNFLYHKFILRIMI
ncbi:hypothetical protein [Paenibacillus alkalitolerans]|uniref:hypothetical protein n=1 Tax=Paenibacillus alkalitolerans TaxID=2799335 RepID=UPI002D805B35|nr:hypothetical protein [Paenibacillus alkalitolerans]